jgi:hypothetical protein
LSRSYWYRYQFQVRIGGCKGIIVVNPFDEGIKLCLRDSMKKFEAPESKELTIEVARAFVGPSRMYLNRYVAGTFKRMMMSVKSIDLWSSWWNASAFLPAGS